MKNRSLESLSLNRKTEYPQFHDRLRYAMIRRDFTNQKLAARIHVTPSAVSAYKKGHRRPSFEQLRDIALALNVSVDYLLGLRDHMNLY